MALRARAIRGVVVGLLLLAASPARADESSLAESLFQQGVAAMQRGDLARACGLLAESQRLDPGGGTLLNLALCHERAGRIATAWARYHEALGTARRDARDDRVAFAEEHIRAIGPRLPRLAIAVAEPADGARVKLDGVELRAGAWEVPAPVDPGEHQVRVDAPGRRAHVAIVQVAEGESKRVDVPPLARDLAPPPVAAASSATARASEAPRSRGGTQRAIGWTLTGLGGGALVGTAVLGVLAIGAESTADAACPGAGPCTDARGLDASERAANLSTAATVTGISGLVVLAGGIVLLLTAPR